MAVHNRWHSAQRTPHQPLSQRSSLQGMICPATPMGCSTSSVGVGVEVGTRVGWGINYTLDRSWTTLRGRLQTRRGTQAAPTHLPQRVCGEALGSYRDGGAWEAGWEEGRVQGGRGRLAALAPRLPNTPPSNLPSPATKWMHVSVAL